ncbi:MAG: ferritin-like domain-containing protein [Actinomycetes bacterium]
MTPLEALQTALAGEHAAVYAYGVLGGRVSASAEPVLSAALRAAHDVHRVRRDQLTAMVRAAGEDPVAAAVSYELPNRADTARRCRRAAGALEQRCAGVYAAVVGSTARANRQWAIDALTDAAVRGLAFGVEPTPWPGAPEL